MSDQKNGNSKRGPIYGVALLDYLPLDGGTMRQALPSRADLVGIQHYRQGQRVVAGYEVLLEHYRRALVRIAELEKAVKFYTGE